MIRIKIRDVLPDNVIPIASINDTLAHIRNIIIRYKTSMAIIVEDNAPVGKISIRDLALLIIKNIKNVRVLDHLYTKDVMKKMIAPLSPENGISEAVESILNVKEAIPIYDSKRDRFIVLEAEDILGIYPIIFPEDKYIVDDIASQEYIGDSPTKSIIQISKKMLEKNADSIVILDILRRPIGIITYTDIVHYPIASVKKDRYIVKDSSGRIVTADEKYIPAEKLMTTPIEKVYRGVNVGDAASLMFDKGIGHLPVIDLDDTIYGVVNKYDILNIMREGL
ncbi:hypothetical protein DRN87_01205 [Candidatus Geothermarchaeota archaeon]|nr:MAG: hypothetical protein DRN87_01205 [Candidatus Geothermarchaeota archaeon]HEW93481.1 CBS domain-containing protein [Thermoprotei archaeon]